MPQTKGRHRPGQIEHEATEGENGEAICFLPSLLFKNVASGDFSVF
jgi:hypothetical protein